MTDATVAQGKVLLTFSTARAFSAEFRLILDQAFFLSLSRKSPYFIHIFFNIFSNYVPLNLLRAYADHGTN